MRLLLDTQLLLWTVLRSERLPKAARDLIADPANQPHFSVVSLWEVAIKRALGQPDFTVEARALQRGLLEHGYVELPVIGGHALAVADLPLVHKDPFDRLLIAQTTVEGFLLLTADPTVARYPGPIRKV